jgi:hypothetical protein
MAINLKSNPDGISGAIQVNGVDAVPFTATGIAGIISVWISGRTYVIGDLRYSPVDFNTYKRITAGAGTTDPSLDVTNWSAVTPSSAGSTIYAAINFGGF